METADAVRAGAPGIFAHGLLVLLAAQRDLAARELLLARRPITLRAHLRRPVPVGARIVTTLDNTRRFTVVDADSGAHFIGGAVTAHETSPVITNGDVQSAQQLDPAALLRTVRDVERALGAPTPTWLGLQAACFERFLDSVDVTGTEQVTVLQTRHDVTLYRTIESWRPENPRTITLRRAPDDVVRLGKIVQLTVYLAAFDAANPPMRLRLDIQLRETSLTQGRLNLHPADTGCA
ncbi:MAG: hypothetical protein M5U09_10075 [Gammaproteobacteria bacterium]|nr:hypothetical protein [Gammaproteobacteria bacterium]